MAFDEPFCRMTCSPPLALTWEDCGDSAPNPAAAVFVNTLAPKTPEASTMHFKRLAESPSGGLLGKRGLRLKLQAVRLRAKRSP